jgi:hypothetical protein
MEKPEKPGPAPGPQASAAEWSAYAQALGKWSDWIKEHPEDDEQPVGDPPRGPEDTE